MRSAIAARLPLFCLLAIAVSGAQALAGIAVDAGPDKAGDSGVPLQLDGAVTGLAPLHFWTADGDDGALWQAEDMIVEWSDETGLAAIGPIQDSSGGSYGWPSDLILIGPTVYGVNTSKEILFSFDPATTLATPIGTPAGGPNWDTWLGSLAYDPGTDAIYSMDWGLAPNRLFVFDRSSETWSVLWSNLPFSNVRGLVWNEQESLLYLADADSGEIHTLDPSDASTQYVVTPGHDPGPALAGSTFQELFYDELEIYDDRLFGTLHARIGGVDYVTLNEIDLVTGGERQHGPTIAESDGHALLIWSMPERVTWRVLSGPGVVSFDSEHEAVTNATFSADGLYELELSVAAPGEPADTVTISMPEPNALAMQAAGAIGIVALGRRRARCGRPLPGDFT